MIGSVAAVRQGIANNLAATFTSFTISPYVIGNVTPPCMYVQPDGTTFDLAMNRALDELHFTVRVLVTYNLDIPGQQALDLMCAPVGPTSVKAAIESDNTLGGSVGYCRVTQVDPPKLLTSPGAPEYLSVDFKLTVVG